MALEATSKGRFNLEKATILMLDGNGMGMDILVQIVTGLGAKSLHRCQTVDEAKDVVKRNMRWRRFFVQFGGLAKVGSGSDYAASLCSGLALSGASPG